VQITHALISERPNFFQKFPESLLFIGMQPIDFLIPWIDGRNDLNGSGLSARWGAIL
jgi:hypothetical protein